MTAPLVPVALAFGLGTWLGLVAPVPPWLGAAAAGLAASGAAALGRRPPVAAGLAVLALVVLAGWARALLPDPTAPPPLAPGVAVVEGWLATDPDREDTHSRLPLVLQRADGRPRGGSLLVHAYGPLAALAAGDRVRVTVDLTPPPVRRNPVGTGALRLPREGPLIAVARRETLVRLPPESPPWWLRARLWIGRTVAAHLPPVSAALCEGLLIGERRRLPPELVTRFRAAGVYHVLAISGFNVGLVAGTVFLALRLLRLPPRAAAGIALPAVVAFALVVGAQPSVLRATLMAGLVLAGQLLLRETTGWNSLAAALLALLLRDPDSLAEPGFQLSFAATAGILHLARPLEALLAARLPRALATALAVSTGAQLAVTPLLLAHWGEVSLVGVFANLLVIPLAGLLTVLGLAAVLAALASEGLAHLLFQGLWPVLLLLRLAVRLVAALPGAVLHAPPASLPALIAAVATLVAAPYAVTPGRRRVLAALVLAVAGSLAASARPDGRLHLLVLDAGQAEVVLVRGPDGTTLLVDAGDLRPRALGRLVRPVAAHLGLAHLAAVVLTRPDAPDPTPALSGLTVGELWRPASPDPEPPPGGAGPGAPGSPRARGLQRGDRLRVGALTVTVLHPPPPGGGEEAPLVLRVEAAGVAMLLAGRATAPVERALLAGGLPLETTILVVARHGSRHATTDAFLAAVGPRLAVVPVGAGNPFGHPAPETLARLVAAGARVYRTDLDGAVEIRADRRGLEVRRWTRPGAIERLGLPDPGGAARLG